MPRAQPSALVIIPTYNERENIESIVERARATAVDVLIVDDGSPDGTGEVADRLAASDAGVTVLHRAVKQGLGPAYLAGFRVGLDRGYEVLLELDADGSHPPEVIPTMLGLLVARPGLAGVIGSRWVEGGSVVGWPRTRELISRGGSWYARTVLGLPVRDVTAGFRAYRATALASLPLDRIESQGYCFQIDMTRRLIASGALLAEVPIEFRDRRFGTSKMSGMIVLEAMLRVTGWGLARVLRLNRPAADDAPVR